MSKAAIKKSLTVRLAGRTFTVTAETSRVAKKGEDRAIFLGDESGSPTEAQDRWMWGLADDLLRQARRAGRDFTYIGFTHEVLDERIFHFPGGVRDDAKLKAIRSGRLRGGTNLERPLGRALEIIASSPGARADVILCTDGLAPQVNTEKLVHAQSQGLVTFHLVAMESNSWMGELKEIADTHLTANLNIHPTVNHPIRLTGTKGAST